MDAVHAVAILCCCTLLPSLSYSEKSSTPDAATGLAERLLLIEARLKEIDQGPATPEIVPSPETPSLSEDAVATLAAAEKLIQARDYRKAYLLLKQIRGFSDDNLKDSPVIAEACLNAARLAGINYRMARFKDPRSIWVLTEPEATFQWVCSLEALDDEKSRILIETLLLNTPTQFWRRFDAFREKHFPEVFPWRVEVELDNGKVARVSFAETSSKDD